LAQSRVRSVQILIILAATFHSPSPTPLLPAPSLSAGERRLSYKVTGGKLKVSARPKDFGVSDLAPDDLISRGVLDSNWGPLRWQQY